MPGSAPPPSAFFRADFFLFFCGQFPSDCLFLFKEQGVGVSRPAIAVVIVHIYFFFFLGMVSALRPPMNGEAFALSTSLFFFFLCLKIEFSSLHNNWLNSPC